MAGKSIEPVIKEHMGLRLDAFSGQGLVCQTFDSVEDILPAARDIVELYCKERGIDELSIEPIVWGDILDELNIRLFEPNKRLLKTGTNRYNEYDRCKIEYVYKRIYKKLCTSHKQEVSQKGFLDMVGIDKQTLYNWGRGNGLSGESFDLQQKIEEDNEESLWALMKGDKGIPTKYLAKLNRYHGWSLPGTNNRPEKRDAPPTQAEIAARYGIASSGEPIELPPPPEVGA